MWQQQVAGTILAVFAAVAFVLAVVGVHAVTSHSVEMRRAEMGIRLALGADHATVVRTMVAQSPGTGHGWPGGRPRGRLVRGGCDNRTPSGWCLVGGIGSAGAASGAAGGSDGGGRHCRQSVRVGSRILPSVLPRIPSCRRP